MLLNSLLGRILVLNQELLLTFSFTFIITKTKHIFYLYIIIYGASWSLFYSFSDPFQAKRGIVFLTFDTLKAI